MDLSLEQNIRLLLKKRGLRPARRFGQNFIVEKKVLELIVSASELKEEDIVLEIGPGIGTLTRELAKTAGRIIAVEKDREMVGILKETLAGLKNVEIVNEDVLRMGIEKLPEKYKIVGNLPFYITAPAIRKFLETDPRPQSLTLVVQKEVAQRICAAPPKMSILANSVQFYANPEIISFIPKKYFWPQPEVDAAVIKITPRPALIGDSELFFKIVKAGFLHPRKQLGNNLSQGLKKDREMILKWLQDNGIKPAQRAETLTVDNWLKLADSFVV